MQVKGLTDLMTWTTILTDRQTDRQTDRVNSAVFFEYNKIEESYKHPEIGSTKQQKKLFAYLFLGVFCIRKTQINSNNIRNCVFQSNHINDNPILKTERY